MDNDLPKDAPYHHAPRQFPKKFPYHQVPRNSWELRMIIYHHDQKCVTHPSIEHPLMQTIEPVHDAIQRCRA